MKLERIPTAEYWHREREREREQEPPADFSHSPDDSSPFRLVAPLLTLSELRRHRRLLKLLVRVVVVVVLPQHFVFLLFFSFASIRLKVARDPYSGARSSSSGGLICWHAGALFVKHVNWQICPGGREKLRVCPVASSFFFFFCRRATLAAALFMRRTRACIYSGGREISESGVSVSHCCPQGGELIRLIIATDVKKKEEEEDNT